MKISMKYEDLVGKLGYVNTILNDKSVEEKLKNIIFLVNGDEVKVVAYSAFTFVRSIMEGAEVDLEGKEKWVFQIKASEVNKIVSAFSNLYKTKVGNVDFEEDGVRIKMVLHEEAKSEEDAKLARDVAFMFENPPVLPKVETEINQEFPTDVDMVSSGDMLLYLDSLYPLIANDTSNGIGSRINFAKDYVFVLSNTMSAFMVNKLPDAFKDLCLTYSSSGFLKKMTEATETIGVARMGDYLCIQEGSTDAFLRYSKVKVKYEMYVNKRSKEKGIVLDRLYLRDVLRRMATVSNEGSFRIEGDDLFVSNSNFNQVVPLNKKKGIEDIAFKSSVGLIDKSILGKDDTFPSELFCYFVDTARGWLVFLSDSTGAWFTNTQVTRE